jgi:Fis family transcriptional regulator
VHQSLEEYFGALNGHDPSELYDLVVSEVEQPLFEVVMEQTGGNLTRAAQMLGINRGTLRKKLRRYGLD